MITFDAFKNLIFEKNGVSEAPHFDRVAFKTKRIFITYQASSHTANFKFTTQVQAQFCELYPQSFTKVPNKFGDHGWTTLQLDSTEKYIINAAIEEAWLGSKT